MIKLTLLLMLSTVSVDSILPICLDLKDNIESIIFRSNISIKNKVLLYSQSLLETGNFKHIKHNNIFGIMLRKGNRYRLRHYVNIEACVIHRLEIFKKSNYKILKSYASDVKYSHKLNKIVSNMKRKLKIEVYDTDLLVKKEKIDKFIEAINPKNTQLVIALRWYLAYNTDKYITYDQFVSWQYFVNKTTTNDVVIQSEDEFVSVMNELSITSQNIDGVCTYILDKEQVNRMYKEVKEVDYIKESIQTII